MPKFIFHMGVNARCYGNVEVEADDEKSAVAMLTADYVGENIDPHETTWDRLTGLAVIEVMDGKGEHIDSEFEGADLPSEYDGRSDWAPSASTATIDYQALARRLSDALLNVRPLGGSEMFIKVGDQFYADPELCARLIHEHRMKEIGALKEVAVLRKEVMAYEAITPPGKLSIGLPPVDRMPLDAVAAEALEIVRECDSYGERAQHPTTIRTRQLLERLAKEASNG